MIKLTISFSCIALQINFISRNRIKAGPQESQNQILKTVKQNTTEQFLLWKVAIK